MNGATRPGSGRPPGPRGPAAPARVDYGPQLDRLAADIEAMHLEYEKFFNGGLAVPPAPLRAKVEAQLRELRNAQIQGAVERFRLAGLEARFTSFSELQNRRLRIKEEGRRPAHAPQTTRPAAHDPERGITLSSDLRADAVEALYAGLHRNNPSPPRFDLDSFGTYLRGQLESIRQRTGASEVQFRVALEEGKLKLKARPVSTKS